MIYVVHGHRFSPRLTYPRSLFYSVSTTTTFGDGTSPPDAIALSAIALQLLVTLYFVAVIVAIVASWASDHQAGESL